MPTRPIALLAFVALALAPLGARAEDAAAEAARRYDEGTRALRADRFGEAASAFDRAFALRPHGATAFMAATAWESAGDPVRAADAWARAVASTELAGDRRVRAEKRLEELERTLGTVIVSAPDVPGALARVDDAAFVPLPARLHGRPGDHVLEAHDHAARALASTPRPVRLGRGASLAVSLSAAPLPGPVVEPAPLPAVDLQANAPPTPAQPRSAARVVTTVALAAIAVGAFVGSAVTWSEARDTHAAFDRAPSWELRDRGLSQVRWTNGLLATGVVAATAAATAWLWPARD